MSKKIKVLAGDFRKEKGYFMGDRLLLVTDAHTIMGEQIMLTELESVEIMTEKSIKKLGNMAGWSMAGMALCGPVGLLAGILMSGKSKEITFAAKFKDGRKLLASTDIKTFAKLQAAVF